MQDTGETTPENGVGLTESLFRTIYKYEYPEEVPVLKKVKKTLACSTSTVKNVFPILQWLPKYSFRSDIIGDLIAGLTVAVMHIPHGLAYGPLAGQQPVVGLYMAVFPSILYLFFGTSRHLSLGTFAVVCMMTGKTVSQYAEPIQFVGNETLSNNTGYSPIQVGVTVCFVVGLWQFVMGVLHLGSLWLLLSNSLVSGFTAGAAVHVTIYQVKNLLGVQVKANNGPLKLVYLVIDLVKSVPDTNLVTFGLAACAITILAVFNDHIKPVIQKKCKKLKIPVPMELIVILLGIAVSYFLDLEELYQVNIVKNVPDGLPEPILPVFELIPSVLVDCFVIAVVAISMNLSLGAIFAKKGGYEIMQNQELVAYGAANVFASLFHCIPTSASLSRSMVQYSVGGKSQIASIFTMIIIILILLFLGPLFEPVPYSILSSIVVVTLKGLLWQIKDFPGIWKRSKFDGAVWLVTFLSVVLIDLDIGLGCGLATSVITLVLRGQFPSIVQLGRIPEANLFMDINLYKKAVVLPNILILKITGALHFANFSTLDVEIMKFYKDFQLVNILNDDKTSYSVVLDLGCVPSLDPTAVTGLSSLFKDLKADNCNLYLTDCNCEVFDFLDHCQFFEDFPKENVFVSTFDAIEFLHPSKMS